MLQLCRPGTRAACSLCINIMGNGDMAERRRWDLLQRATLGWYHCTDRCYNCQTPFRSSLVAATKVNRTLPWLQSWCRIASGEMREWRDNGNWVQTKPISCISIWHAEWTFIFDTVLLWCTHVGMVPRPYMIHLLAMDRSHNTTSWNHTGCVSPGCSNEVWDSINIHCIC